MPLRIGILGAVGTGKTTLCNELAATLIPRGADVVIMDAPSLTALEHQSGDQLFLLMGLDIAHADALDAEDTQLRSRLQSAGVAYRVIYGRGPARLANALRAVDERLTPELHDTSSSTPWVWTCEKCSDPVCEHRLFSRLTARTNQS